MMLNGLDKLNQFNNKEDEPTNLELASYLFWSYGHCMYDYPIPYVFAVIKAHKKVKDEEEKAMKKASKGK